MLEQIKTLVRFVREFPPARSSHLVALSLGGILMSLLEFVGLSAIFPFMLAVQSPDIVLSNRILGPVFASLGVTQPKVAVALLGLGVVGIFIVKNVFFIVQMRFEFSALARWRVGIANRMLRAYIDAPYEYMLARNSSQMISVITSVIPYIINNFIHQFFKLFTQALVGLAVLLYMLKLDSTVALILLAVAAFLLVLHAFAFRRVVVGIGGLTRTLTMRQLAILQQSLKGFKDTRLHQKGDYFVGSFAKVNRELSEAEEKIVFLQNLPTATIEIIMMSLIVGVFWAFMVTEDNSTIVFAKLSTLAIIAFRTVPIVNRSITAMAMINSCREPLEKLFREAGELSMLGKRGARTRQAEPAAEPVPLVFERFLALENVTYAYPGARQPAVEDISFRLGRGEFLGITGHSGSGKSTLVGLLLCLLPPARGHIIVDGRPLRTEDVAAFQSIIGYVDQNIFLLDGTVAENVAYGEAAGEVDRARVVEALRKAQLDDFVAGLPEGIDTRIGEDGKNLSGGQRQRLSIARAFYKRLQILILDEASATLDVETEHRFFEFLYGLKGEITVIMIAHRLATLKGCDRILFMERGLVMDEGTFEQLSRTNAMFRRYVEFSELPSPTGGRPR